MLEFHPGLYILERTRPSLHEWDSTDDHRVCVYCDFEIARLEAAQTAIVKLYTETAAAEEADLTLEQSGRDCTAMEQFLLAELDKKLTLRETEGNAYSFETNFNGNKILKFTAPHDSHELLNLTLLIDSWLSILKPRVTPKSQASRMRTDNYINDNCE